MLLMCLISNETRFFGIYKGKKTHFVQFLSVQDIRIHSNGSQVMRNPQTNFSPSFCIFSDFLMKLIDRTSDFAKVRKFLEHVMATCQKHSTNILQVFLRVFIASLSQIFRVWTANTTFFAYKFSKIQFHLRSSTSTTCVAIVKKNIFENKSCISM